MINQSLAKKALIVSPYLDHLGGGERYMLLAAAELARVGYQLTFAWDNSAQITSLAKQLGIAFPPVSLAPRIKELYSAGSPFAMYRATRSYDLILYLSDGSIPLLGGRKNILHLQIPHQHVHGRSLGNRLKLSRLDRIIVNSKFTKKIVDNEYGIGSLVIYPPVIPIEPARKQKLILSVGRFEPSLNIKRHDVLIEAFKELSPQLPGWKLALAGASDSHNWLTQLETQAHGLAVKFYPNVTYSQLCQLYGVSRIYWHAAGYGVEPAQHPELCEHFGISIAESVTAGCIPLVVGKGGVGEIVQNPAFHWQSIQELVDQTMQATSGALTPPTLPSSLKAINFGQSILRVV